MALPTVVGFLVYFLPATAGVPAVLALTGLYVGLSQWRFNEADLWLPLATPALVQLPLALFLGLMGRSQTSREVRDAQLQNETVTNLVRTEPLRTQADTAAGRDCSPNVHARLINPTM